MREFLATPVLAHVGAGSFDSALAFVSESQGSAQDDRTLDVWEFPQFPSPHGPPALRSGILRRFILTSEPRYVILREKEDHSWLLQHYLLPVKISNAF